MDGICRHRVILQYIMLYLYLSYDLLYVYDGYDRLATEIDVVTGSTKPNDLVSTGPALFMSFVTDTSLPQSGFKIKYQTGKYKFYFRDKYVISTQL